MGTHLEQMKKHFESHGRTKEYTAHQSKVHSVAWSCDGRRLASGSFDKTVCIFSLERDRLVSGFDFQFTSFSVLSALLFSFM